MDITLKLSPVIISFITATLKHNLILLTNKPSDYAKAKAKFRLLKTSMYFLGSCGLLQLWYKDYERLGAVTSISILLHYMNRYDDKISTRWLIVIATGMLTYIHW